MIVSVTVVVCVTPPPVPWIVMVRVPVLDLRPTLTVIVEVPEPGAAIELGLNVTLFPLPAPEAVKLIAELKPPDIAVVIVEVPVPEPLREIVIVVGAAPIVKLGFVPVTVNETVVVEVVLPEVPFTVIGYVPVAVDAATVIVMVDVPAPVIELGLKATVTPAGWPEADKEMAELKPPVTVLVIVEFPALPCVTVTEPGDADKLNPGVDEPPARALISALPFGLPQPLAKSYPIVVGRPLEPLEISWKSVS